MIAYLIVIAVALIGGGILFIFKNKKDTLPIDEKPADNSKREYFISLDGKEYDFTEDVKNILKKDSPYKNKEYANENPYYMTTLDDPIIIEVAKLFQPYVKDMSDFDKANFILRFVQNSIKYTSDMENYGVAEKYVFPVNTLIRRKGDCEDVAFLFASLAYLNGLDVINVIVPGHVTTGVALENVDIDCMTWKHNGKTYYHAEATGVFKIGEYNVYYVSSQYVTPMIPDESFKNKLTDYNFETI